MFSICNNNNTTYTHTISVKHRKAQCNKMKWPIEGPRFHQWQAGLAVRWVGNGWLEGIDGKQRITQVVEEKERQMVREGPRGCNGA